MSYSIDGIEFTHTDTAIHQANVVIIGLRAKVATLTIERNAAARKSSGYAWFIDMQSENMDYLRAQIAALTAEVERLTPMANELQAARHIMRENERTLVRNHQLTVTLGKAREALEQMALLATAVQQYPDFDDGVHDSAKPLLFVCGKTLLGANDALAAIDGVLNCNKISTPLTDEKGGA